MNNEPIITIGGALLALIIGIFLLLNFCLSILALHAVYSFEAQTACISHKLDNVLENKQDGKYNKSQIAR